METFSSTVGKGAVGKQKKHMRVVGGGGAGVGVGVAGNGTLGISSIPSFKNSLVACSKCGCKKRHARTCPLKKKGEDDDEMIYTEKVVQKIEVQSVSSSTNAGSLFCYLDVAALKKYKKHYRLKTRHNSTKAELANAVRNHFESTNVDEIEVIDIFLMKVKTNGGSNGSPTS